MRHLLITERVRKKKRAYTHSKKNNGTGLANKFKFNDYYDKLFFRNKR